MYRLSCSQQTPVSEDTTALFGPPLETAFGEQKTEGNMSYVFVSLCFCTFMSFCVCHCLYRLLGNGLLSLQILSLCSVTSDTSLFFPQAHCVVVNSLHVSLLRSKFKLTLRGHAHVNSAPYLIHGFCCHLPSSRPLRFRDAGFGRPSGCKANAMCITNIKSAPNSS